LLKDYHYADKMQISSMKNMLFYWTDTRLTFAWPSSLARIKSSLKMVAQMCTCVLVHVIVFVFMWYTSCICLLCLCVSPTLSFVFHAMHQIEKDPLQAEGNRRCFSSIEKL